MSAVVLARAIALAAGLLLTPLSQQQADAHTVSGRVLNGKAAIAEFRFSDGSPMAFAEVKVFAPSNELWLAGRADGAGRFAFMPDKSGQWTLEAREAEENHTARLSLTVDAASLAPVALISHHWGFALLGSFALNIGLGALLRRRRPSS
jgi:nickel transport protein